MQTTFPRFSRRTLLRGLGAATTLLPFVPRSVARGGTEFPRRIVFFFSPNGMWEPEWLPTGTETAFTFKQILEPLEPFKPDLLVLDGIDWKSWYAYATGGGDHPPALSHTFCATTPVDTSWGGGPSIDQLIAQRVGAETRFDSLVLGVKSQTGDLGRLSYRAAHEHVPAVSDPAEVFARVFADLEVDATTLARLRADRRSVIDFVSTELSALQAQIGVEERPKLEAHLEHLRAIELRLDAAAASCAAPAVPAATTTRDLVRDGPLQMDLAAMALACDLTRVVMLQWSYAGSGERFPWLGIDVPHHQLAHQEAPGLTLAEQAALRARIGRWHAEQLGYLLAKLRSIPEGDGTLLDHTVVVWTSEHRALGGAHDRHNVPYLLAGSCGGTLRTGRFVRYPQVAHNDLYVSLCHAMGLEDVSTFGNPAVCSGPLTGLT